ncbi:MAG TPA: Smr/MutS family protein [Burkholderiales bacterium]|nr:Smr/MutS family protein [Burkholderiales bacterium]
MDWPPEDVVPLPEGKRAELPRPRPAPLPRQTRLDEAAVLRDSLGPFAVDEAMDSGEELLFVRPGVSRQTLRKMRRGHWVVEANLDLHGLTRAEAAASVGEFLQRCAARRLRCVRIVHGKGLGVLKAKLRRWLPMKDEVLAFTQAPSAQGGSGALLVLLRSGAPR